MDISIKKLYKWLANHSPKIKGIEIRCKNDTHKVFFASYYRNPNGIILWHPTRPNNHKPHKFNRYEIIILEPNHNSHTTQITSQIYYKENQLNKNKTKYSIWQVEEERPTKPCIGDMVTIIDTFYHDKDILKRYYKLKTDNRP